MAETLSVASWNVKHFGQTKGLDPATAQQKIKQKIAFLAQQQADIVALYEVRSAVVFRPIAEAMPEYQFFITEGPQTQEILVGIHRRLSGFVTQKLEFKSSQPWLRPGVLVTVNCAGQFYSLLFLHLKSMTDAKGFGLRDDMLQLALKFRSHLDKLSEGKSNYLFVGDLNTMGLNYPYRQHDISAEAEIHELERRAKHYSKKMELLPKAAPFTWSPKTGSTLTQANLDHVVAADHLSFTPFGDGLVDVRGWPQTTTESDRDQWLTDYSDHALLYFEIQTPEQQ